MRQEREKNRDRVRILKQKVEKREESIQMAIENLEEFWRQWNLNTKLSPETNDICPEALVQKHHI